MFEIHSPHFTTMECLNVSGTNREDLLVCFSVSSFDVHT